MLSLLLCVVSARRDERYACVEGGQTASPRRARESTSSLKQVPVFCQQIPHSGAARSVRWFHVGSDRGIAGWVGRPDQHSAKEMARVPRSIPQALENGMVIQWNHGIEWFAATYKGWPPTNVMHHLDYGATYSGFATLVLA